LARLKIDITKLVKSQELLDAHARADANARFNAANAAVNNAAGAIAAQQAQNAADAQAAAAYAWAHRFDPSAPPFVMPHHAVNQNGGVGTAVVIRK
jgi:hypothetical protein